jgi:hypothetical protein
LVAKGHLTSYGFKWTTELQSARVGLKKRGNSMKRNAIQSLSFAVSLGDRKSRAKIRIDNWRILSILSLENVLSGLKDLKTKAKSPRYR